MIQRLGGGRQVAGAVTRGQVGLGRRRRLSSQLEVACDQRRIAAADRQHLCHPPVQQPPAGQPRPLLDHHPQAFVGEVVLGVALDDQPARLELLQAADHLVVGAAAGRPHRLDVERTADHRRGGQHLGGRLGDGVQAGAEDLLRSRPGATFGVTGHQQLGEIQRQTLALGEEPIGDPLVQARCPRQLVHVGCGQPAQGHPVTQLGEMCAGVVGVGLVGAPGGQQQHPPPLQPPADVGERIDRRGIARVQVVHEHDPRGSGISHHRQQLTGGVEEALAGAGLAERRRGRLAELWQQPGGLGATVLGDVVAACLHGGPQQLGEHAVGQAALARVGARRHHPRTGSRPRAQKLLRQPRLADSRLSLDHDHATVGGDRVVRGGQRPPRTVTAHQRL